MSWWPDTSSSVTGRYFSTLQSSASAAALVNISQTSFRTHHGRLSSASTGRLAALLLPLVASAENVISADGAGPSTSISSSKSDILEECKLGITIGREAQVSFKRLY